MKPTNLVVVGLLPFLSIFCAEVQIWTISDVHLNSSDTSNKLDTCCDTSVELYRKTLDFVNRTARNDSIHLLLGDYTSHLRPQYDSSRKMFDAEMKTFMDMTASYFRGKPVFPVFGNYDQSQNCVANNRSHYAHLFDRLNWNRLESGWGAQFVQNGGFYEVEIGDQLSLIVVNSVLYVRDCDQGDSDLFGQIEWLRQKLQNLRNNRRRALIASHFPIGIANNDFNAKPVYRLSSRPNRVLFDLLTEYSDDVIVTNLFGHQHISQLQISQGKLFGLSMSSISPINGGTIPAVRLVRVSNRSIAFDQFSYRPISQRYEPDYTFPDVYLGKRRSVCQINTGSRQCGQLLIASITRTPSIYLGHIHNGLRKVDWQKKWPMRFLCLLVNSVERCGNL